MAIELIGKIKPKNNGAFPLVDAEDVEMPDGTRLSEFKGGGSTDGAETVTKQSTSDELGNHFLSLSGVGVGTALSVTTTGEKVLCYKSDNWFPNRNFSVTQETVVTLPVPLPVGYYAVSAAISEWGVENSSPQLQMLNADGTSIAQTITGVSNYNMTIADSFNTGRYGARFYAAEPIVAIKIYSAEDGLTSLGKTTTFEDFSLWYSPTVHPTNATSYAWRSEYDGVAYDIANGEKPVVTTNNMHMFADDYKELSASYETGVLAQAVEELSQEVDNLHEEVADLATKSGIIHEDAPDYEYIPLNLAGGWSDFAFVGDKLWVFKGSGDEVHTSADGKIYICNPDTGAVEKTLNHDFGHCNTVHYNPKNDKLLIGNLPGNSEYKAALYIFDDVAEWASHEDNSDVLFANKITTIVDVSQIVSDTGTHAYATVACWGDENNGQNNIVYVNGQYNRYWWKILLGTGTNNLGKGTYTAAADGEYNGTYEVLWSKEFALRYDANREVTQGIDFVGGVICTANGHNELQWWDWDFSESAVSRREHNVTVYKADGTTDWSVSEGFAVRDGYAYVGCIFTNENRAFTDRNGFIKTTNGVCLGASITKDGINALIDEKLGVIENGIY
ncbi:MAG: hypothetical protein IKA63_00815 [Clostridia bacterium]|nr:hypothetical protein [Clostridia bacterium]MBR3778202.1 hypothetical protein [Clostridia bacterium]